MTPHDELMSRLIQMQKYLLQYVDEFNPGHGLEALTKMDELLLLANEFVEEENWEHA